MRGEEMGREERRGKKRGREGRGGEGRGKKRRRKEGRGGEECEKPSNHLIIPSINEDVEQIECLHIIDRNAKDATTLKKVQQFLIK